MFTSSRRRFVLGALILGIHKIIPASAHSLAWCDDSRTMRGLNTLQSDGFILSDGGVYSAHPYANGGSFLDIMPPERRALIKSTGFDFIRMTIDFGPLLSAANNKALDVLIDDLISHINAYTGSKLKVIVTMMAGGDPTTGWQNMTDGVAGPKYQRLLNVWRRFAGAIGGSFDSSQVAVELFNEPPFRRDIAGDAWPIQQKHLFDRVRAVLPGHTIVVTGDDLSAIDRVVILNPADYDANTMYRINGYEPFSISHQGDGYFRYIHRLTFPPEDHPGGKAQAISDVTAAINADNSLSFLDKLTIVTNFTKLRHAEGVDTYFDTPCNSNFIENRIKKVTDWAANHGLSNRHIIVGEFGARGDFRIKGADDRLVDTLAGTLTTRANFMRTWREKIEAAKLGAWCAHEARGPDGFSLTQNEVMWKFTPELMTALGLNA